MKITFLKTFRAGPNVEWAEKSAYSRSETITVPKKVGDSLIESGAAVETNPKPEPAEETTHRAAITDAPKPKKKAASKRKPKAKSKSKSAE